MISFELRMSMNSLKLGLSSQMQDATGIKLQKIYKQFRIPKSSEFGHLCIYTSELQKENKDFDSVLSKVKQTQ